MTTLTLAHNRPSLDDLCGDPSCLKNQPLEVIALLIDEAKNLRDKAALASKLLQGVAFADDVIVTWINAGKRYAHSDNVVVVIDHDEASAKAVAA